MCAVFLFPSGMYLVLIACSRIIFYKFVFDIKSDCYFFALQSNVQVKALKHATRSSIKTLYFGENYQKICCICLILWK